MFSSTQLADCLKRTRVLVVGDLMLDCYYWGKVRRISPEAPVPIVKVNEKTYRLGGAGNVIANLSGLGCQSTIVSVIGQDAPATQVKNLMASFHVDDQCVVDTKRPTTTKTRIMADKQQVVRLDEENGGNLGSGISNHLFEVIKRQLALTHTLILSDYGKGLFASADFIQNIIKECGKTNIPVFIDPKGRNWHRYTGATCITPNTAELELVIGEPMGSDYNLTSAALNLCRELSFDKLLVTRGPKGMTLVGEGSSPVTIAAKAREVFDVSGAGDTVIATLAACVASGLCFSDAASVANSAAGIVVGKLGTQPVTWPELERALDEDEQRKPTSTLWKAADVSEAEIRLARWRQEEQRIVFTNGCFDLLHPGHVSLLHQARRLGDRLIVGLNTDDSIKRLKGPWRPILPGPDRAAILSALEDVDMVVFFDEDTPLNLIGRLRPDILVKGADYRIGDVVGKDIVESYGGQVRLVDILEGHSTTTIARKLSENSDQTETQTKKGVNDGD